MWIVCLAKNSHKMKLKYSHEMKNRKKLKALSAAVVISTLTSTLTISLGDNSADNKLITFFSQKTGFDISCKLSPLETICMKCQSLFSGKNNKIFEIVICWFFLPSILSVYLFVLRFHSPVNPLVSCQGQSVYLTMLYLGRLSPLSD